MPVKREVRYLSTNDLGKLITYDVPTSEGTMQLGGMLEQLATEATWLPDDRLSFGRLESRQKIQGTTYVNLTLSGQKIQFGINQRVTVHGTDQQIEVPEEVVCTCGTSWPVINHDEPCPTHDA